MNRLASLIFNVMVVIALVVGAVVLLFNLVFSPAWQQLSPGILPAKPIEWLLYADNSPINQPRILQTVNLWARLDPLPNSANNIVVDSDGELFSKVYIVRFDAPAPDVEQWLRHSRGIIDETPESLDDGKVYYRIRPRDAQFADVTVAPDSQSVLIRAAWDRDLER
jgi:hypothetical protein